MAAELKAAFKSKASTVRVVQVASTEEQPVEKSILRHNAAPLGLLAELKARFEER